jgi:hypothetical protein
MLLSAVSVLVIALQSLEIPEGLMNNPVFTAVIIYLCLKQISSKDKAVDTTDL